MPLQTSLEHGSSQYFIFPTKFGSHRYFEQNIFYSGKFHLLILEFDPSSPTSQDTFSKYAGTSAGRQALRSQPESSPKAPKDQIRGKPHLLRFFVPNCLGASLPICLFALAHSQWCPPILHHSDTAALLDHFGPFSIFARPKYRKLKWVARGYQGLNACTSPARTRLHEAKDQFQ